MFSAALVCTITIRWVQLQRFAVWDDALITYRCARNLASGFGFVYNPGEMVLGVTTPLFGLFLGLVAWLGGDVYTFAPILNIGVDCILLALVMRWAWTDASPLVATLFGFAFALEPQLSASTVGGMEVNVFTLASLG